MSDVADEREDEVVHNTGSDKQQEKPAIAHPWPYLREMFTIVGSKNDSCRMSCVLCKQKRHELLAYKNSPSNLKKHIEVNN